MIASSYDAWKLASPPEARSADLARCDACGESVPEDQLTADSDGPAFCRACIAATRPPRWEAAALLAERMRRGMR